MNPGNPYATPQAAVLETQAPDELIAALPVSAKWQTRFRAIQRAGGAQMPDLKQLSAAERRAAVSFNILAFLFGPIYYACKGMWKKALTLFLACAVVVIGLGLVLDHFGYEKIANAMGYGVGALFAVRANIDYYKKMVLGDNGWW
jgi:hypothetical protein